MKYLFSKFKDVGLGVLPILLVVLVLHFSFAHFETNLLLKFIGSMAITVVGESMSPNFHDGDIVLVKEQPEIEIGQIGIFICNNEGFIKSENVYRIARYKNLISSQFWKV